MKFIWIEILKFIRNNWIKMLIGITLFVGVFVWTNTRPQSVNVEQEKRYEESGFETDANPAYFRFFAERPDGGAFTNNILVEQYITRLDMLEELSNETDTKLKEIVIETENKAIVNYNESGETKVIGVSRDGNSHLSEFYVNIGNEEDNLKIARYFYDYIQDGNVPFFEDKNVVFFQQPTIKKFDDLTFEKSTVESSSLVTIIKNTIIAVILGGTGVTALLLFKSFFSKKLIYSFTYSVKAEDYFFLVDRKLEYEDELNQILLNPKTSNRVIVYEETLSDEKIISDLLNDNSINKVNSLLNIPNLHDTDRLIYIIKENKTKRDWYNKQRKLDRLFDIPTVVIQINED